MAAASKGTKIVFNTDISPGTLIKTTSIKSKKRPGESGIIASSSQMDLTRTHRAFGLFPNALLVFGYGNSEPEKSREFTVQEKSTQTGESITRHLKVYTESAKGLPRGRDPQVLQGLLYMIMEKGDNSNSIWFRKAELLEVLGWTDTPENRQDIEKAVERYFETAYRGLNIHQSKNRDREHEKVRRIITGFDKIDERLNRHKVASSPDNPENERLFSKVVFDPDFINDVRGSELSLIVSQGFIRTLQRSPITYRLYEVINYLTSPDSLNFSVPIIELAHERLGISKTKKSPSQCWQAIEKAGEDLVKNRYLLSFEYHTDKRLVSGTVNPERVRPLSNALAPLPKSDEKRKYILQQFVSLGCYPNGAGKLIDQLPDELLDDAEIIVEYVRREKNKNIFGANFKWGGRAFKQLKHLAENKQVDQSLLSRHLLEVQCLTANNSDLVEPHEFPNNSEYSTVFTITGEAGESSLPDPPRVQLPLTFTAITIVDEKAADLWKECLNILRKQLSSQIYKTWFEEKTLISLSAENNILTLQAQSEVARDWISQNYRKNLQSAINSVTETIDVWRVDLIN